MGRRQRAVLVGREIEIGLVDGVGASLGNLLLADLDRGKSVRRGSCAPLDPNPGSESALVGIGAGESLGVIVDPEKLAFIDAIIGAIKFVVNALAFISLGIKYFFAI